ncbi:hypothetical protein [Chondromyces crocatus]|nr:hypothetical protein [Chondromyces crocatus]
MAGPSAVEASACSVLLLDLQARDDGFIGEPALTALAERLAADGRKVRLARLVHEHAEAREKAEAAASMRRFLGEVQAAVRAAGAEVVVLVRAWDGAVVEAARYGLRDGAVLVRLARGVRAELDGAFDHVVDEEGLHALLRGEAPATAEFRRLKASDLRRQLAVMQVAGSGALGGEARGAEGVEIVGARGRATLSGPSGGCPYLADARKNPVFDALSLDPARVQTRGCSFCLDNTGAYAAVSAEQVVGAWIAQLRALRAAAPRGERIEVLLTDERPHPHLPALFETLMHEPGLGPIELLWKSRVDWLLEFAESAVAPACALAEASGSVLHLYLVGFESFDREALALFNKGHGPEESERAIALMRAFEARFPGTFVFREHRAHGFLLFTPWTSPASLLENASWMRRLRFHELRADAIQTRLRLYPRTPLHHLAVRDGLLVEASEEGRGDRAAEQGYDASAPWRFQDARVEAIFQLAQAVRGLDRDRGLTDADVIDVATRYVVRWPGLAAVPGSCALALRAGVEAWGAPLGALVEMLGPAGAGFDPEIEALALGENASSETVGRRAVLKESVRATDAEALARAYQAMGFAAEVIAHHGMERRSGLHGASEEHAVVAVARDEAVLGEVRGLHRVVAGAGPATERRTAARRLGGLMGYPGCCAELFAARLEQGDNQDLERAPYLRAPEQPLASVLHRTGLLRLISHHPCAPGCVASVANAEGVLGRLAALCAAAATGARATLAMASLFLDYERYAVVEGGFEGERFVLHGAKARSVGRGRGFAELLAQASWVRLGPDGVTLGSPDGSTRKVSGPRPLLVEPGKPLAAPARGALLPEAVPKREDALRLPGTIRPGVRAGGFTIASVATGDAASTITLARGEERLAVRVRAHAEGVPYAIRIGAWAVDLDVDALGALGDEARAAVGLLVRALAPAARAVR